MWQSLPDFGTGVIYAVLVLAAYTFAVSLAAGRGQPRLLRASRLGAYATSATVLFAVLLLTYAFVTHDFRIRYVSRYSDRSMPKLYLITSLWGGQDGSLLWWSLLLSGYTAGCVTWMKGRYRQLQPYVIATLMVVISFFMVLMLFAANPFEASIAGARPDGDGLNPLLQNYWMVIHPPCLYMGFVGCAVPFAFCVAALATGRLDNEWINAVRKWMLFAFLFLSIGNVLGMAWAYEELGWGGFWAWDPVENAACLPWFTATAYVHSTMIQERRNMLKIWNVFLICLTFLLTLFGTFLTRAGIITSVHSFAQSDIGKYFLWFIGIVAAASLSLAIFRQRELRGRAVIESVASREAMFVVNNWALLGGMSFIFCATMYPKLSELWGENTTVGPAFFNRWMAPIGLVIFALMGLAPLFGWRKTSDDSLKKALRAPLIASGVTLLAHIALGSSLGYPAFVQKDPMFPGFVGTLLQKISSSGPLITVALAAFNVAVIVQEFQRGVAARRRSAEQKPESERESVLTALLTLVSKSRRRYGGYIVHLGVVCMFIGFVGTAWNIDRETSLTPGQSLSIGRFELTYKGSRMCPGNPRCSKEEQADSDEAHDLRRPGREARRRAHRHGVARQVHLSQEPGRPHHRGRDAARPARRSVHDRRHRGSAEQARHLQVPRQSVRVLDLGGALGAHLGRDGLAVARVFGVGFARLGLRARRRRCSHGHHALALVGNDARHGLRQRAASRAANAGRRLTAACDLAFRRLATACRGARLGAHCGSSRRAARTALPVQRLRSLRFPHENPQRKSRRARSGRRAHRAAGCEHARRAVWLTHRGAGAGHGRARPGRVLALVERR
ncbi:MAG: cytochrome c biogenesis protein CcsA [Polyangiaceae bacterium]